MMRAAPQLVRLIGIPYERDGRNCLWIVLEGLRELGCGRFDVEQLRTWTQVGTEAHHAREIGDVVLTENEGVQGLAVLASLNPPMLLTSMPLSGSRLMRPSRLRGVVAVYRRPAQ